MYIFRDLAEDGLQGILRYRITRRRSFVKILDPLPQLENDGGLSPYPIAMVPRYDHDQGILCIMFILNKILCLIRD